MSIKKKGNKKSSNYLKSCSLALCYFFLKDIYCKTKKQYHVYGIFIFTVYYRTSVSLCIWKPSLLPTLMLDSQT